MLQVEHDTNRNPAVPRLVHHVELLLDLPRADIVRVRAAAAVAPIV